MTLPSAKPAPRGKITKDAPLGRQSWFGCGGTADLLFEPADFDDLVSFLKEYPQTDPLTVLGGLANTIIRDGGIRGCVIRLGKPFVDITVHGTRIKAGAGALNGSVAAAAVKAGIGGLEFLSGVPGTVGGALRMNAGAYGSEVKDVLVECTAVDRGGSTKTLIPNLSPLRKQGSCGRKQAGSGRSLSPAKAEGRNDIVYFDMTYRHTGVPADYIFTQAVFQGVQEDYDTVKARLTGIKKQRNETQPIKEFTGGSTFANPASHPEGKKAWQLVEEAGCRGLQVGGAQMSEMHCNFMINTGGATASDLENLGDEIIRRVADKTGVTLKWEIKRIGER